MEIPLALILLIILVLLIIQNGKTNEQENRIKTILDKLDSLTNTLELYAKNEFHEAGKETIRPSETKPIPPSPVQTPVLTNRPVSPPISISLPSLKENQGLSNPTNEIPLKAIPDFSEPLIQIQAKGFWERFMERNPDLEKFIGENLVNKIGIAVLVLAIGFFVKYAIDNNWIGPVGRVAIGILAGGLLIGTAHRLRKNFHAFSSVLAGGGLAVLYFSITLAFSQFHLFNQTTAFLILIGITCFSVVLSLLYDREELGVIALVGGLLSPFLVSGSQANYLALFFYLLILNIGLLFIAFNKLWRILNTLAFVLTVLVFAWLCWLIPISQYSVVFFYSSLLYILYFSINISFNIRETKKFLGFDFSLVLLNTAIYFGAGLYFLNLLHLKLWNGSFTLSIALLNLIASYILFRIKKVDKNILYLLIGITLTFISLTAPIQLNGHYITLFWSIEMCLLYWLYLKSEIQLMKLCSIIIWNAMLISLFLDISNVYLTYLHPVPIILNKGFITLFVASISNFILYILVRKDPNPVLYGIKINPKVFRFTSVFLLFISGFLEINYQSHLTASINNYSVFLLDFYIVSFAYILFKIGQRSTLLKINPKPGLILLILALVYYFTSFNQLFYLERMDLTTQKIEPFLVPLHISTAILIGLIFWELIQLQEVNRKEDLHPIGTWILVSSILLFLSLEFSWILRILFYKSYPSWEDLTRIYTKVILPILWGLCSFALIWLGFHFKRKDLRIISLSLFSLTLLKLFLFDIQNIPPTGKIFSFFLLGILLLVVSFMYQKLKIIIVDEDAKKD